MIAMLHQAVKDALDAGFTGLCAGGDMSWLLDEAPGSERLVEYEARLNHFYRTNHALGLCLYNVRTIPAALLDHCMATPPTVRMEDSILLENPFYELPETAVSRIARPQDVDHKIREIRSARVA
jgi:two-component system, sensor histidine kinase PdtaS